MRAIHGAWGRTFEVYALAVIAAAVAGAFELVLAGLPIWSAAKMCTSGVDHKHPVRRTIDPDAIFLLKFGIDAESKFRWITDLENGVRLKKGARKKKSEEGEKPCCKKCSDTHPYKPPSSAVNIGI